MRTKARLLPLALAATLLITGCASQLQAPSARILPRAFKMPNHAMAPTLASGEVFIADLAAYEETDPSRWDIVVFRPPHDTERIWAFRVVGLPGEKICFEDGYAVVDGERLVPPSEMSEVRYDALAADGAGGMESYHFEVPEDQYYVLGDNARRANDSRVWGSVPRELIMGRITGL
jgi:signal peptidase I